MKKEKNKKNEKDEEVSKEDEKIEADIKKEIVIHSMPKRFFKAEPVVKQSKGIGILILLGGGIVLIAIIASMYFFVLKKDSTKVSDPKVVQISDEKKPEKEEPKEEEKVEEKVEEKTPEEKKVTITKATTTGEIVDNATSTKKTISAVDIEEPKINVLKDAEDFDGDGLFDEEENLFSTKKEIKDSDGDGYEDLAEIKNLYNPAGDGNLMVNDGIEKYLNSQFGFYFYYPKSWEIDKIDGNTSVIFKAKNNQFIQIIIQSNNRNQTLEEWYNEQSGGIRVEQKQKIYKKGWLAIESVDGLSTYLMHPSSGNILIMAYSIGIDNVLYYKNIYNMMINSLEVER